MFKKIAIVCLSALLVVSAAGCSENAPTSGEVSISESSIKDVSKNIEESSEKYIKFVSSSNVDIFQSSSKNIMIEMIGYSPDDIEIIVEDTSIIQVNFDKNLSLSNTFQYTIKGLKIGTTKIYAQTNDGTLKTDERIVNVLEKDAVIEKTSEISKEESSKQESSQVSVEESSVVYESSIEEVSIQESSKEEVPVESSVEENSVSDISLGNLNALKKANSYLSIMAFSYSGLIEQLEYEGFSTEEATYGADNCGADWNEQALKKAKSYLDTTAFSYSGLVEQLKYEGFTDGQAEYGVSNCGADWNEQAAKKAQSYLDLMAFSKNELIEQLEFEGFTSSEAAYGASAVGY